MISDRRPHEDKDNVAANTAATTAQLNAVDGTSKVTIKNATGEPFSITLTQLKAKLAGLP